MGSRFTIPTLAMFAALMAIPAARAADMPLSPPAPEPCCSSWYLRGFVGVGMNGAYDLDVTNLNGSFFASKSIGDSSFIGGGLGYDWNNWLRFDGTVEYRAKSRISALAVSQPAVPGPVAVDQYEGNLQSWVLLANAYVDLGTWNCLTPFVGAGIGGAYNMVSDFTDVTPDVSAFGATGSAFGLGRGTNNWDLAWALYAGLTYNVSKAFKVDLTYRYLNFGSAKETVDCFGATGCNAFTFKDLHSNDIMLSLRWTCCDVEQPRYVYSPPPPPPPLHSKG
jgi:opacity protein-like surface antigen